MTKVSWSSSGDPEVFVKYGSVTDTAFAYPAKGFAPVKHQKGNDGRVMLVLAPAVDLKWLPNVSF